MQAVLTHIRAAALILVHIGMVIGLEAGHTERFLVSGSGRGTVTSHDCGARERHISLDHLHNCHACVVQFQHAGTWPAAFPVDRGHGYSFVFRLTIPRLSSHPSLHHSGLRGPPCA